jgi:hypothetical protein
MCGHEVLVAYAKKVRLIYGKGPKTDKLDAENLARLARVDPKLLFIRSSTEARTPRRLIWHSSACRAGPSSVCARATGHNTSLGERSNPLGRAFRSARPGPSTGRRQSTCQTSLLCQLSDPLA